MAMKKADLAAHRAEYEARMRSARESERSGLYRAALENAVSAWDYIDGMMQYERRYEEAEFNSIPAIDLVLKYAPLLFQYEALEKLAGLLKEQKRIEKHTEADMGARLRAAAERMWSNHKLWTFLDANPDVRQDQLAARLGGDQDYWRSVAEAWEAMGVLLRVRDGWSYRLSMTTRLGQVVDAKCPACGHKAQAPKAMMLERTSCPSCEQLVSFVFTGSESKQPNEG